MSAIGFQLCSSNGHKLTTHCKLNLLGCTKQIKGLELVIHQQLQNVIVEGDALLICTFFQGHSIFFSWNLIPSTLKRIIGSMRKIGQCSYMNCSQMANSFADALSRLAPPVYTQFSNILYHLIFIPYICRNRCYTGGIYMKQWLLCNQKNSI